VWVDRRTDRQTDMTKLVVAFHKFANAPKIDFGLLGNRDKLI